MNKFYISIIKFLFLFMLLSVFSYSQKVKWHISFTISKATNYTTRDKMNASHGNYSLQVNGASDMIVEEDLNSNGYVLINTEQYGGVVSLTNSGTLKEIQESVVYDNDGKLLETRKDNYQGTATNEQGAFTFEFHPTPDGGNGINAGISFDKKGYYEIKRPQELDNRSEVNQGEGAGVGLGSKEDVITKVKNGFLISCSSSKEINEENYSSTKKGRTSIEYLVTIIRESDFDAYIEPDNKENYKKWLPKGPDPKDPANLGNTISFKVYVINKTKPGIKSTDIISSVDYILDNPSHEPGYAMNYPSVNPSTKADLQLVTQNEKPDTSIERLNLTVTKAKSSDMGIGVQSFDYGANGKLRAIVHLSTGDILVAKESESKKPYSTIPYRTNENSVIANKWKEDEKAANFEDTDDNETGDNLGDNKYKGDGFSLYEEYRGFIEDKKHIRTSAIKKDVMICDKVRDALIAAAAALPSGSPLEKAQKAALPNRSQDGINMFGAVTGFVTHSKFKSDEFGLDIGKNIYDGVKALDTLNLPSFSNSKVLNLNTSGYAHLHEQSGILLLPSTKSLGYAAAFGKTINDVRPPKDWYCLVITADWDPGSEGWNRVSANRDSLNKKDRIVVDPLGRAKIITDEYAVTVAHEMLHYCNVKHHGDGKDKDMGNVGILIFSGDLYYSNLKTGEIFSLADLYWDKDGQQIIGITGPVILTIAGQGGTHSGVEDCIMRYDNANTYQYTDGKTYVIQLQRSYSAEIAGITLCDSKTGTGVNEKYHKPRPRYGDATNGNCKSQVCINDKYHQ